MKYIRLYTIMNRIPNNKEIINMPSHHSIDVNISTTSSNPHYSANLKDRNILTQTIIAMVEEDLSSI